jgi:RsiW-degrading membrane proteinase PrsW (M82 family)
MKKDKKYWALEIAQLIFFLIVPIALFIWKCTTIQNEGGTKFIINCSGFIFAIIIFIVFKKVILKKYLSDLNGKIVNYTTQIETETDQTKIPLIEKALSKCLIIRDLFIVAPVLVALGLLLVIIKAIEQQMITLYSVIGMCVISYTIGFICMLFQSYSIKSKNRRKNDKGTEN